MKTPHTPGPWQVKSAFPNKAKGHTFEPRVSVCAISPVYHLPIRIADIPDVQERNSEDMANARLMAAAPEMLAALQRIVAWADTGCDPSSKSIEVARTLIKRVTGERTTAS